MNINMPFVYLACDIYFDVLILSSKK